MPNSQPHRFSVLEEIYRGELPGELPEGKPLESRWHPSLPTIDWQRVIAPLTVVVGVLTLAVGLVQLWSNINSPAVRLAVQEPSLRGVLGGNALPLAGTGVIDTDGDGLSNYQELTVYGTSPYLEDTDSDGIADGAEVKAGSDPNCPVGQNCTGGSAAGAAASPTPISLPGSGMPATLLPPVTGNPLPSAMPSSGLDLSTMTPSELRQRLQDAGLSPELLSSFSDQQLLQAYQEVLQEEQGVGNPNPVPTGASNVFSAGSAGSTFKLTPDQIRQGLLKQGVPAETVNQLSDVQLQQLLQETAQEMEGSGGLNPAPGISPTPIPPLTPPGVGADGTTLKLTPEQLRQGLLKQGVPPETVSQLTDQQLQQLMDETFNEMKSGQSTASP